MFKPSGYFLRMTLCDPQQREKELQVDFRILDTAIARRWSDLMAFLAAQHAFIGSPDRFYNFPNDPKDSPEWIRRELKSCVEGLKRLAPGTVEFDLDGELTQEQMNHLHEIFVDGCANLTSPAEAMLRSGAPFGEVRKLVVEPKYWESVHDAVKQHTGLDAESLSYLEIVRALDGSPDVGRVLLDLWYTVAPASPYLERLNIAIHRWEDWNAVQDKKAREEEGWKYQVVTFYPCRRFSMTTEDCAQFTIRDTFGRVYLDDITEGKSIWDVFRDQDEIIAGDHYKTLAYFWGNFRVYYGPTQTEREVEDKMTAFWKWFEANEPFLSELGFRRDDPRMTIGALPVADLERRGALANLERSGIVELIGRHQYVKRIEVVDGEGTPIRDLVLSAQFGGWSDLLAEFRKNKGTALPYPLG